jgi:hypothetical protein
MNMFQGDLLADQPQQLQQGYLLVRQVQILADQLDSQRRYVVFAD